MNASANEFNPKVDDASTIPEHVNDEIISQNTVLIILFILSFLLCIYFCIHNYCARTRNVQNGAMNANSTNAGEIVLERQTSRIPSYTKEHEIERSNSIYKSF